MSWDGVGWRVGWGMMGMKGRSGDNGGGGGGGFSGVWGKRCGEVMWTKRQAFG